MSILLIFSDVNRRSSSIFLLLICGTFLAIINSRIYGVYAQFWKLKEMNEREMFLLETKSNMPSGICYRMEEGQSVDPELRTQLISFCCNGYQQLANTKSIQCEPICTEDCGNGICTAPDSCECFPGYERLGGRCEMV